jgi:hypothetical protein
MRFLRGLTWVRLLTLVGLLLDVIGVVMIAAAVINIEYNNISATTLQELEDELNAERASEGIWSIVGTVLIVLGSPPPGPHPHPRAGGGARELWVFILCHIGLASFDHMPILYRCPMMQPPGQCNQYTEHT